MNTDGHRFIAHSFRFNFNPCASPCPSVVNVGAILLLTGVGADEHFRLNVHESLAAQTQIFFNRFR
ncbi:MAG: hypothetical protein M3458_13485 [Acidobacteriota bacterium]|nr:hypothetical protein [Acidobacteriota bacterium]